VYRGFVVIALVLFLSGEEVAAQPPYRTSWNRDGIIVGAGMASGIGALLANNSNDPLTVEEINNLDKADVNAFDRGATEKYSVNASMVSDWTVGVLIVAPAVMLIDRRVRDNAGTQLLMYAETILITGATQELVKGLVPRTRPFVYNPDVPIDEKTSRDARKSFYSGHTAFAFASATFLSVTYGDYFPDSGLAPYVWGSSMAAACVVGYLRYSAGRHFPTDVLTGAVIGTAIGYTIPALHRTESGEISLTPEIGEQGYAVAVTVHF